MPFDQMIADLPGWAKILIIIMLTPTVTSAIALIRSWSSGNNAIKVKELETQITEILSERDERLTNAQLQEQFVKAIQDNNLVHRQEMQSVATAIREAAMVKRDDDKETRLILDNNNTAMSQITKAFDNLALHLDKIGVGLSDISESNKAMVQSNFALHNDVRIQLEHFEVLRHTMEAVRAKLEQSVSKKEFQIMRENFIELFDGIDDAIEKVSLSIQRQSTTQPISNEIAKKAIE